jgi:hypothetical protein
VTSYACLTYGIEHCRLQVRIAVQSCISLQSFLEAEIGDNEQQECRQFVNYATATKLESVFAAAVDCHGTAAHNVNVQIGKLTKLSAKRSATQSFLMLL